MKAERWELSNNPQGLLLEAVHYAGYFGALDNPFLDSESTLNTANSSLLEEFFALRFVILFDNAWMLLLLIFQN